MRKRLLLIAVPGLILTGLVLRRSYAQDPLDSLVACRATQKLIFENTFVRAIDDVIPPGVSEPKHRHPHGVVVALEDAEILTHTYPSGRTSRSHATRGTVTWNEPLIHDVTNVGQTPSHFIRIDVK